MTDAALLLVGMKSVRRCGASLTLEVSFSPDLDSLLLSLYSFISRSEASRSSLWMGATISRQYFSEPLPIPASAITKKYSIGCQSSWLYSPTTLWSVAEMQVNVPISIMSRSSSEIQLPNTSFRKGGSMSYMKAGKCGRDSSSKIHLESTSTGWIFGFLDIWLSEPEVQISKVPTDDFWISLGLEMSIPASFAIWKNVAIDMPSPCADRHLLYCLSVSLALYSGFCWLTRWKIPLPASWNSLVRANPTFSQLS